MFPDYQDFMQPFLEILYKANRKETKLRDVINQLANRFNLIETKREEILPSGKQTILDNRVGSAKTYLSKAELLKTTRRAINTSRH